MSFGVDRTGRKTRQLCEQVRESLQGILAGSADEVLQGLVVMAVEPAPHTGRLMVTVAVSQPADATDRLTTRDHLAKAIVYLRLQVAGCIHRRKAPELVFHVE